MFRKIYVYIPLKSKNISLYTYFELKKLSAIWYIVLVSLNVKNTDFELETLSRVWNESYVLKVKIF